MTVPLSDFHATIRYLEELITRPILPREQVGLVRIQTLLAAIDHPERRFAAVQVAGTTGKGSTTTMTATILREAGYRTGAFVSPHLQSYRERIAVDGVPIDEASWVRLLNVLLPILDRMEGNDLPGYRGGRAAFLDVLWAMACLAFVERGVQYAVIETGLGGRLDPTTANEAGVAVITNVSLDHVERLGNTVEQIATEKSGLIKHGQRVVSAAVEPALGVVREACVRQDAELWSVGERDAIQVIPNGPQPDAPFAVLTPVRRHAGLRSGLLGVHQRANAACAVGAIDALVAKMGATIPPEVVSSGLARARMPGRLELLAGRPQVLLDGAHNVAGAQALADALRGLFGGRRIILLLGILGDKDYSAIAALLSPLAAAVMVSEPPWKSRAGFAGAVTNEARRYCAHVEEHDNPADALERAQALAGPDDLVVVAGSLYLVGAVRDLLCPEASET